MPRYPNRPDNICPTCGASFRVYPSELAKSSRTFCSRACYNADRALHWEERFWALVDKSGECWLWLGKKTKAGYGVYALPSKHATTAHRLAWIITNGPVPKHIEVCHDCPTGDNPSCVRPSHMFTGTRTDNMRDAQAKDRLATGERNSSAKHPERLPHGDAHYWRQRPEVVRRGEQVPTSKLKPEQVITIRAQRADGLPLTTIAAEHHISIALVSAIALRKVWAHLP